MLKLCSFCFGKHMPYQLTPLRLYMALAYTLLVGYGSLHPFVGWRDIGADVSGFLFAPLPRYWTFFDCLLNTIGYIPLGMLWVVCLPPRYPQWLRILLITLCGMLFSIAMEWLQNFLPSRVASNLDVAANALGTLIGAWFGALWGMKYWNTRFWLWWRDNIPGEKRMTDTGLVLLGLWLFTQLSPHTLLFANGDIRDYLGLAAPINYSSKRFFWMVAAIVGTNTLAVAITIACLFSSQRPVILILCAALIAKTLALTLSLGTNFSFAWLDAASLLGFMLGLGGACAAQWLPKRWWQALAALALLLACVLVNLAPINPYRTYVLQVWTPGQLLNFLGVTKFIAALWPYCVLPWLIVLRLPKESVFKNKKLVLSGNHK